ncbi:MAG: TIM barrel protein [Anaerolineae bacterium]
MAQPNLVAHLGTTCVHSLLFGTAGVPRSINGASHLEGVREVGRLGLHAMELAFVHQVNIRPDEAPLIRAVADEHSICLSVHAPYYINLNSKDKRIVSASRQRILRSARIGFLCGARHIVFHAAWRHDASPAQVYEVVRSQLLELSSILQEEGTDVWLCPETTGRSAQFGDLDELLALTQNVPRTKPCIDFAHLHARAGLSNSSREFEAILDAVEANLGHSALLDMHLHVSGIGYGAHGETRHLSLAESDFQYYELLTVLARRGVMGRVICESPSNDADAMLLSAQWREICGC